MSETEASIQSSIVAVYPDQTAAEHAVRRLHKEGLALGDLSIVGTEFRMTEEPYGFVTPGDYAKAGALTGASFGGLFGLVAGAAFLVLPGFGVVVAGGPIATALLAAIEGGMAGTALGCLAGALIGWGVPKDRALKYETHLKGGKFLVVVRSNPQVVDWARKLLAHDGPDHIDVYHPAGA
jgi:hypothetical protein